MKRSLSLHVTRFLPAACRPSSLSRSGDAGAPEKLCLYLENSGFALLARSTLVVGKWSNGHITSLVFFVCTALSFFSAPSLPLCF